MAATDFSRFVPFLVLSLSFQWVPPVSALLLFSTVLFTLY